MVCSCRKENLRLQFVRGLMKKFQILKRIHVIQAVYCLICIYQGILGFQKSAYSIQRPVGGREGEVNGTGRGGEFNLILSWGWSGGKGPRSEEVRGNSALVRGRGGRMQFLIYQSSINHRSKGSEIIA